ncbi:MAG: helix-turn-helix transcriptional regulator [Desulfotomaculum sp.]|nr:helix-turn-helix transcriptional regulator [Desulfotomaculum sp.]
MCQNNKCNCSSGSIGRFLQPCLLLLLHRSPNHGYGLIQSLGEFGFSDTNIDPGSIYRQLRKMEEEGLVKSQWSIEQNGPAKRLYHLTNEGEELIHAWAAAMEINKQRIETFLSIYKKTFRKE